MWWYRACVARERNVCKRSKSPPHRRRLSRNLHRKSICLAGCHVGSKMPAGAVPAARVRRQDRLQAGQESLLQAVPGNDTSQRSRHRGRHKRHRTLTEGPGLTVHASHRGRDTRFRRLQVPRRRALRERHGVAPSSALARRDEVRQVPL